MEESKKYSLAAATALVIANMIGTGVFTSLGYQVEPLPSGFVIMLLWLLGGLIAVCGALTYAEIAVILKRSGGEYLYLSKIFHPVVGFCSGWMSTVVGFAGAVSAVALAIGEYATEVTGISAKAIATGSIIIISIVHLFGVRLSGGVQTFLTSFKLSLIIIFCLAPLLIQNDIETGISFLPKAGDFDLIMSAGFAVSLVFVVYAYTGWNAAAYIAGNLDNPTRNLPRSLITGTLVVVLAYLALNSTFLNVASLDELNGQNDIGNVAAVKLFGNHIGNIFAGVFSFALLSTLSAMTIAGPRVIEAMGEDYQLLKSFSSRNRFNMPYIAIITQAVWAIFLVVVSSFKEIIQYISVSLSFFSMLTVIGIFFLRKNQHQSHKGFKVPLYPLPPIIFTIATCWMIYYVGVEDFKILLYAMLTLIPAFILYYLAVKRNPVEN